MGEIPFTQYLPPNGQKREVMIERPNDIHEKAKKIMEAGFRFECEQLQTMEVSFTISDDDGDYAIEVCPNGPKVPKAVDKLITNFDPTRPKEPISG